MFHETHYSKLPKKKHVGYEESGKKIFKHSRNVLQVLFFVALCIQGLSTWNVFQVRRGDAEENITVGNPTTSE